MRGTFLHCKTDKCGKLLAKDVWLRPGSRFTVRCWKCGAVFSVLAEGGDLSIQTLVYPQSGDNLTEDEESATVFLHT